MRVRTVYMLLHTPVHIGRPVLAGLVPKTEWSEPLFKEYLQDVERTRKAGGGRTHLTKRQIERWGFFPPCGARFEVMEVDLPAAE